MRVHRRRLTGALIGILTLAGTAVGCAPSGFPTDDATTNLQRNLQLPDDRLQCMRQRFEDDRAAAAVMDPEHEPSADERAAFVRAARACISIEGFAALLAASLQADPGGGGADPTQADCVKISIESMPPDEQDQLYLHFANPAALDADAVREPVARLAAVCGLGGTDPTGTVVGPVPTATDPDPATSAGR